jgi:hypothetical protein
MGSAARQAGFLAGESQPWRNAGKIAARPPLAGKSGGQMATIHLDRLVVGSLAGSGVHGTVAALRYSPVRRIHRTTMIDRIDQQMDTFAAPPTCGRTDSVARLEHRHADTPNYKARDIDFQATLDKASAQRGGDLPWRQPRLVT